MAKSFEEAFRVAKAAKAATSGMDVPVQSSAAVSTAAHAVRDQDLWSQQLASVTPLPGKNGADLTITSVTDPRASTAPAGATQIIASADVKRAATAVKPSGKLTKACNQNLADYYERLAKNKSTRTNAASSPPKYPHLQPARSAPAPQPAAARDRVSVSAEPDAQVAWHGANSVTTSLLKNDLSLGLRTQISNSTAGAREVFLGLDFGTSSAKVVFGDRGLQTAHAVPFLDAIGIDAYLLPARLYETGGVYSLHGGARHFNDLKLALLANPNEIDIRCRVVGYLALAIREARAWLFTAHAESFLRTKIFWTLALGLPAEHAGEGSLSNLFAQIGTAAWAVAGHEVVSRDACRQAFADAAAGACTPDVEVVIVPEIAAQIYGFANSSRFDPKARNFFLIADVGAGTVDTCLFRLIREKGGSWSFEIYAATVEPAGVMNLHRDRIRWWQHHLSFDAVGARLCNELDGIKLGTENQVVIPPRYLDYLSGVRVQFDGNAIDPDKSFFETKLLPQVRGRTLYQPFIRNLLGKEDIVDLPFFLCGGGARLGFYRELGDVLRHSPGYSWLSAKKEELTKPDNLRADGVGRPDYDRLSVAYGLSMLNLAKITTEAQIPKLTPHLSDDVWREHYIDKDEC